MAALFRTLLLVIEELEKENMWLHHLTGLSRHWIAPSLLALVWVVGLFLGLALTWTLDRWCPRAVRRARRRVHRFLGFRKKKASPKVEAGAAKSTEGEGGGEKDVKVEDGAAKEVVLDH